MKTIIFVIIIVFSCSAYAQISLGVSAGYNPKNISSEEVPPDGWNVSWDYGYSFGFNAGYYLSPKFLLSASFNYSQYNFDKYLSNEWIIPEIHFISSTGKDSYIYRISVESKYYPLPKSDFRFFILFGLGYVAENFGEVRTTYLNDLNGQETKYIIKQPNEDHLVPALGIGITANLFSNIYCELSGYYYSNYSGWWQPTISFGLGYNFL